MPARHVQARIPVESNLPMATLEQIVELERKYLLQTYNRYPVVLSRGKGVFLYDLEGKRYLDFVAGLGGKAFGHAPPRVFEKNWGEAAEVVSVLNLLYHQNQGVLGGKVWTPPRSASGIK